MVSTPLAGAPLMTELAELMMVVDSRPAEAGAKRTEAALGSVGKAAGTLQRTLLGLAGGLGATKLFGDFAKQTSALETSIRRIAQLQGLGATASALKDVERALGGVTSNFFDRGDLAAGALEATRANFSLAESLEVTAAAQGLARDTGLELAKAVGLTATALKALGQGAGSAGNIAGALGLVADLDAGGIQELVGVLQKVAPEARQVTVEYDELLAAFKIADDEGQAFTTTGRDLAGILNALEGPTKESSAALAQLGLTFADIDPRARRLDEIFAKIATRGPSAAQLSAIFGQGNSATASALVRNAESLARALEEIRRAAGGESGGASRSISEAIQGIANAYNNLLLAGRDVGGANAIAGSLDVLREVLNDIAGLDVEVSAAAVAVESLVAAFSAVAAVRFGASLLGASTALKALTTVAGPTVTATTLVTEAITGTSRSVETLTATTRTFLAFSPFAKIALASGALTAAIPAIDQFLERMDLLRNGATGGPNRDVQGFGASFDSIRRTAFVANSPAAALNEQSKAQLAEIEKAAEAALSSGNIISQRAGVAGADASKVFLEQVLKTFEILRADGSAAATVAANDIANAFARPLLESIDPKSDLAKQLTKQLEEAFAGIGGGERARAAANDAAAANIRIADALRATTEAAEREAAQMEALNEALRLENGLALERSFLGISEGARAVAEQVEAYRQTLVAAGVTGDEYAARLSGFAGQAQALADAQAAATRSTDDLVRAQAALGAVEDAVSALEFERATVGKTSEDVANLRRELEFTQLANDAFGEGTSAAADALDQYRADLAKLTAAQKQADDAATAARAAERAQADAAREAAEANRRAIEEQQRAAEDLARAFTGPVQSSIDSYVEALLKGQKATLDFRDVAAEIGAGVFSNLVTKPATDAATKGLAGLFGGLFGQGDPTQSPPAGVPGQAGAAAAAAVGGAFTPAGVVNIQAAVVNLAQDAIPGVGGAPSVAGSVQGLAGLASAFGGGNSPTGTTNNASTSGSSLLGLSSLAANSQGADAGTTSTAEQAQVAVQPTTQPDPNRAGANGALTGAVAGAQIGTAIAPGIGSAIGFVAGALLGYAATYYAASSRGNVFSGGRLVPHRLGGIVDQYSAFPLADGGIGTIAEDGPEAILPLRRGRGGRLGVDASGGGRGGAGAGGGSVTYQTTVVQNFPNSDVGSFRRNAAHVAAGQRRAQRRQQTRRT